MPNKAAEQVGPAAGAGADERPAILPTTAITPRDAGARGRRHHVPPGGLSICIRSCDGFVDEAPRDVREERPDRLGFRRSAGVRQPGAGRHAGPAERAGFRPRHLQPAAPRFLRLRRRPALHSAAAHGARAGAVRRLRQLAQRIRGAGFRIRLQRGRSADAGALGSAVRRFRRTARRSSSTSSSPPPNRSGASRAAW